MEKLPKVPSDWKVCSDLHSPLTPPQNYTGNYTAAGVGRLVITGADVMPFGGRYMTLYSADFGVSSALEWLSDEPGVHHFRVRLFPPPI